MIRSAHVRILHSALIPVEITAACFDPGYVLLLTGARNGELKVWNFNTGVCLRKMTIEYMCEVTNCFWVEGRILAVGWNRHVVEFEDIGKVTTGKSWDTRHSEDVLAAAVRPPLTLATASYNSELVIWRLETGQPYRRYSCTEPTQRIKIECEKRDEFKTLPPISFKGKRPSPTISFVTIRKPTTAAAKYVLDPEEAIKKAAVRCLSSTAVTMPARAQCMRQLAVQAMIFLQTRPLHKNIASLLLALENGSVQCWSDHSAGGYLGSFEAVHMSDDYVSSFATDINNEFLFTGTIMGYVKVWLMSNFHINEQMNTSRSGKVDWEELVSHLILGYFGNDAENQRESLQAPILGLPTIMSSGHKHPVSRICFCPDVEKDRSTDPMQGSYITASRDGMINWWSLDMKLLRTAYSSSPHLKVRSTWVTDMVCMPDVNIIVTSSTERDLRFYDCTAKTFTLKIVITSWEYMICSMHYHFSQNIEETCKLICGDAGGNIRVLQFSPVLRGPFKNEPGSGLRTLRHVDLQKRPQMLPEMHLVELPRIHAEWVRQVSYYESLHCVVSCATCIESLLLCDIRGSKTFSRNMFRVEKGIQCFAFNEEAHILVTGGPDCVVRVWNPFVPTKANVTFIGHHASIIAIVLQNQGQTIYTLSRDRTIKVWDVQGQTCIQSYIDVPMEIGEQTNQSLISAVYNSATRQFILACVKIAIVVLDEQLNPLHTDGFTHSRTVCKILYNPLFKVIITCGMDSFIINWDPVTGKRNVMIRDAHVRMLHGEMIPVEITAACFDPGLLLLLTGARTGELKVWNFNTGVCIRQMAIEHMCEVTECFWVEGRILAVGWNRHVVEFEDTGMATSGKSWGTRHTDDVLAAAARPPLTLVTTTYNSELVLWKLETGQPYSKGIARDNVDPGEAIKKATARRVSNVSMPVRAQNMRQLAVHACIFLQTRPYHIQVASFLLALENGQVQCWSDHSAGGYQGSFQAIHTAGDYVSAFATDVENEFLFTGTTLGYIKVWLMSNYLINKTVHINMPRLRLLFPFLWRDRIEGRAKRCVRDQPLPLLLNSYRAHMRCITTITYVDELKLVFTGSSDYSARVWCLSGEYLQTLGSFVPWTLDVTRFPPDVKKVASFTTFKVWRGGEVSRYVPGQQAEDRLRDITDVELQHKTFGQQPEEPLLGHHYVLPKRPEPAEPITLDRSLYTIPLYMHLRLASTQPVRRPPTPELVVQTRMKQARGKKKAHFETHPRGLHQSQAIATAPTLPSIITKSDSKIHSISIT